MRLLAPIAAALLLAAACTHDRDDAAERQAPDAGAPLQFMEPCDPVDDRCDDDLVCFSFNAKGPHCTHGCAGDEECGDPSPGCNNMGVCKAP